MLGTAVAARRRLPPFVPINGLESYGGEGGIRTLDGLLTRRKTLRNQQLTDSQQVAIPCIPLISPSLAVGLAVDAQLSGRALLQPTDDSSKGTAIGELYNDGSRPLAPPTRPTPGIDYPTIRNVLNDTSSSSPTPTYADQWP